MKIHEVGEGEGGATLCCGIFSSFLPPGDLLTGHPEIVTCDSRAPRCPHCKTKTAYLEMRTELPDFTTDEALVIMRVKPCTHKFRVHLGINRKIGLEKWDT